MSSSSLICTLCITFCPFCTETTQALISFFALLINVITSRLYFSQYILPQSLLSGCCTVALTNMTYVLCLLSDLYHCMHAYLGVNICQSYPFMSNFCDMLISHYSYSLPEDALNQTIMVVIEFRCHVHVYNNYTYTLSISIHTAC